MAKHFISIEPAHREFISRQHIFFTASAASTGRVNVSPKDASALRVLSPSQVVYLDVTGSGNETAAHLLAHGRLTFMFSRARRLFSGCSVADVCWHEAALSM
jgi:hypothetical protein